jgi:RNA polymerase sigma-70 factor (ECF subfamily)
MTAREHNIIEGCKMGDPKSQYLLYKNYSKAMYNIAIRFLNNKMDAEDVLQESFIKAFERIDELSETKAFGSWLKRIVINNCLSLIRKKKIHFEDMDDDISEGLADDGITVTVDPALVHSEIKKLPEGSRTVLILYALEGYLHKEIAEMLGITESTSRTQYKRALGLLNKSLKPSVYVN